MCKEPPELEAMGISAHEKFDSSDSGHQRRDESCLQVPLDQDSDLKVNVEEWEAMSMEEMQELLANALPWHDMLIKDEFAVVAQERQDWQEASKPSVPNKNSYCYAKPGAIYPLWFGHESLGHFSNSFQGADPTSPATVFSALNGNSHLHVDFENSQQQVNEAKARPTWMDNVNGFTNSSSMAKEASADAGSRLTPSMDSDTDTMFERPERRRRELAKEERACYSDYLTSIHSLPFSSVDGCQCKFCPGRQFFRRHDLVLHVRTMHLHERRYDCKQCGSRFKRKSHLVSHVRALHQPPRAFSCVYCSKIYSSDSSKRKHIRVAHQTTVYE